MEALPMTLAVSIGLIATGFALGVFTTLAGSGSV